jgi:hypothetical protein
MTAICASLVEEVQLDFSRACAQLARARRQQAAKDTSANRAAVVEELAIIDDILDLYRDIQTPRTASPPDNRPTAPHRKALTSASKWVPSSRD